MKMTDSRNAQRNSLKVRSSSRPRPPTRGGVGGRHVHLVGRLLAAPRCGRPARSRARRRRAGSPGAGGRGGRCARRGLARHERARGCRAAPELAVRAGARTGAGSARGSLRSASVEPQLDVVVLVDAGRGSARPPRRRRPSGAGRCAMSCVSTPRSAARSRSISTRSSGLSSLSVVSASTMPPSSGALSRSCFGVARRAPGRSGPADGEVDVEVAAADVERRRCCAPATRRSVNLRRRRADLLHHVALAVVAAEGAPADRP